MLAMGKKAKLSIAEMKRANELVLREATLLDASLDQLWGVMTECTVRGLSNDDTLPGGLSLKRRSKAL